MLTLSSCFRTRKLIISASSSSLFLYATDFIINNRRSFSSKSNNGDDNNNQKEPPIENVEGEYIPVKNLWNKRKWSNGKDEDEEYIQQQQQQAANEAITRLFQDDVQRKTLQQKPGKFLGSQTTSTIIKTIPKEEDEYNEFHFMQDNEGLSSSSSSSSSPLVNIETVEQELLDDAFLYFPPAFNVKGDEKKNNNNNITDPTGESYVPGQQIIPPGMTRYRVDVQYQGSDFDGWWKSTSRQLYRNEKLSDGSIRRIPIDNSENTNILNTEETMSSRYHAKAVLEDALAVAFDIHNVKVISSVIPEVGVNVRRLTCHIDIPSYIELQPRTIIQRATMWLEKRQQPLAILSCQRCTNQDFHARHSGIKRIYVYRILNRVAPPLFDAGLQWHVDRQLDIPRMQRFAKALEGTRDFGYFADPKMSNALRRAAISAGGIITTGVASEEHFIPTATGESPLKTQGKAKKVNIEKGMSNLDRAAALPTFNEYGQRIVNDNAKAKEYYRASTNLPTIRTIDRLDVIRQEDEVLIWFVGKSFLRHQIRNMVSVLKVAGHGLWDELELQQALQSGFEHSRARFKRERLPPAPVHGLTLWDVEYPAEHRHDYVPFVDSGPYEEVNIAKDI